MKTWDDELQYGFNVPYLTVGSNDGRNFLLVVGFKYTRKDGTVIEAKPGWGSDGASAPRPMWLTLPPFGAYWMAAFLHDICYRYLKYSKEFCDDTFNEAMKLLGVSDIQQFRLYEGVRLFGWSSFEEDRLIQMQNGAVAA